MQQVARCDPAAVGHRIQIAFPPIPRGVKADGEPQVAGTAKSQTEEESDDRDCNQTDPGFPWVPVMQSREDGGKQYCRGPEADALTQCEEGIAAQQKLFKQAHTNKKCAPESCKFQ